VPACRWESSEGQLALAAEQALRGRAEERVDQAEAVARVAEPPLGDAAVGAIRGVVVPISRTAAVEVGPLAVVQPLALHGHRVAEHRDRRPLVQVRDARAERHATLIVDDDGDLDRHLARDLVAGLDALDERHRAEHVRRSCQVDPRLASVLAGHYLRGLHRSRYGLGCCVRPRDENKQQCCDHQDDQKDPPESCSSSFDAPQHFWWHDGPILSVSWH
jgi:hypothetical protein